MAKKKPVNEFMPLQNMHHDAIKRVLAEKEGLPAAMARAEQHGIDMTQAKQGYQVATDGLRQILESYFPNGRLPE